MNNERLKTLLYNAIVKIDNDNQDDLCCCVGDEFEWYYNEIGITKEELEEIGIDWLDKEEENNE